MTEVFFYHLLHQTLEQALPALLEKSLQRGWRAVVQCSTEARAKALDDTLWAYAPESFLPHALSTDEEAASQPVLLTVGADNLNEAAVRIFVERCAVLPALEPDRGAPYQRAMLVFDGRDPADVEQAREQWKTLKGRQYPVTYWQQDEDGRWRKKG
jgi:DNA polymerase III subunit chi